MADDGARVSLDVDTICIHGDTPGAAAVAQAVRAALEAAAWSSRRWPSNLRRSAAAS